MALVMSFCCVDLSPPIGEVTVLAGIAVDQSINANQDSGSAGANLESVDPVAILFCLLDTHAGV